MFWGLGVKSAWRNLARSMLAIVSMAMAAGFLTNAISLSRGYPSRFREGYRGLVGGEIVAYAWQLTGTAIEDETMRFQLLGDVETTDLAVVWPELMRGGYMGAFEPVLLSEARQQQMMEFASVQAVYPRYQMPAFTSGQNSMWSTPLRGRDLALDEQQTMPLSRQVHEGRWFINEDHGNMVAVVSSQQHYPLGQRRTGVGDTLQVVVPRITYQGSAVSFDYTHPVLIELDVIGVMDIRTRYVQLTERYNLDFADINMQLYAMVDEIQLPLGTWEKIWNMAGGKEFVPSQVSLMVGDLSYLEDTVAALRDRFPENTFYGIPQLLNQVEPGLRLENPEKVALNEEFAMMLTHREPLEQVAVAMDLRLPMAALIFVNAAMVIASNLLIMVSERRTEIGILKAVGSLRVQVVQMVLGEAFLISSIGALAGFLFFRFPAMLNQMTNGTSFSSLAWSLSSDLLVVFASTACATLVFGMIPAVTMANLSVGEVLQTE